MFATNASNDVNAPGPDLGDRALEPWVLPILPLTSPDRGLRLGPVTRLSAVDPESLPRARRHAHGVKGWGDVLEVSAQTGRNREGRMVSTDIAEQYAQALDNVLDVVWAGGGKPEAMTRLTVYVTDAGQYRLREKAVAAAWKSRLGTHRPALTVVEVAGLLDDEALVAIEAVALV